MHCEGDLLGEREAKQEGAAALCVVEFWKHGTIDGSAPTGV